MMSEDSSNTPDSVEFLINELRLAQRDRRNARNWMSLLLAIVVIASILFGYVAFVDIKDKQVPRLMDNLNASAAEITPMVESEIMGAIERLVPTYQEAFVGVLERDQDRYYEVLAEEYLALKIYAESSWPEIEEAIAELVIAQEETARAKLGEYIDESQLDRINQAYRDELTLRLEHYFQTGFGDQLIMAEGMMDKLQQIAESEEELPPNDSQYILGMFIELLGMEMQLNAQAQQL